MSSGVQEVLGKSVNFFRASQNLLLSKSAVKSNQAVNSHRHLRFNAQDSRALQGSVSGFTGVHAGLTDSASLVHCHHLMANVLALVPIF